MISHTTERFRKAFVVLPKKIQNQAKNAYKQFKKDPFFWLKAKAMIYLFY